MLPNTQQLKPHDIEAWLNQLGQPAADRDYQPGHQRVLNLIAALTASGEVFHRPKLRIRVAGTNGKGSASHYLAAAFRANGWKVGLYTSPHIRSFNERMCLDGQAIDDSNLTALMAKVMPQALLYQTSYFETATVLALLYFSNAAVDVEILEAGVGAKLDATTAVDADVGLLTPVALDHQAWLGETLAEIALDKAYVFDGCAIAISAVQTAAVAEVLHRCRPALDYAQQFSEPLQTCGEHQKVNAGLAFEAIKAISRLKPWAGRLNREKCKQAICATKVPGRLEQVEYSGHRFWLDAAHNEHAVEQILVTLRAMGRIFDVIFLCTREDRDLSACVARLRPYARKMVIMTGPGPYTYQSVQQALECEIPESGSGCFLVLGSFITLGETKKWMDAHLKRLLPAPDSQ